MKKLLQVLKIHWSKVVFISVVTLMSFVIYNQGVAMTHLSSKNTVANIEKDFLENRVNSLESELRMWRLEQLLKDGRFEIDPYAGKFQQIGNSLNIYIDDIQAYGSGTRMKVVVLNTTSIEISNLELSFSFYDNEDNFLSRKEQKIIQRINGGYSRTEVISIPDVKPEQIKKLLITVGNMTLHYYQHN